MCRLRHERIEGAGDVEGCILGLVRMDADRVIERIVTSDIPSPSAVGQIGPDRHDAPNADLPRALQHRVAVFVESCIVDVGMSVEHGNTGMVP